MSGLGLLSVLGNLVVVGLGLGLGLPELSDESFDLIVLLVGLLPLLDLAGEDGDLLDDLVLLVLSEGLGLLDVLKILELFLQLLDGNLVLLVCLLSPVGGELLLEGGDLLVPLVPELLCLPNFLVELVALFPALSGLVDELPDLSVEGVPLGLPLLGLVVQLVPELPVLLSILVHDAALLFQLVQVSLRSLGLAGRGLHRFLCCLYLLLFLRILLLNFLHTHFHKSTLNIRHGRE